MPPDLMTGKIGWATVRDSIAEFFHCLWEGYASITPLAGKVHQVLIQRGENIVNDHVALRTFDLAPINLERLAAPFRDWGFVETGRYRFVEKKLSFRLSIL